MAGKWKLPLSSTQAKSRNFYFGSSSQSPWSNDVAFKNYVKSEFKTALNHHEEPAADRVIAPVPWATTYDTTMQPWSPFSDKPEMPTVRPRTSLLLMRKMLLSNTDAGKAWQDEFGHICSKKVFRAITRASNQPVETKRVDVQRRCESPLLNLHRPPGTFHPCFGDEACIGEATVHLLRRESEMARSLVSSNGSHSLFRAETSAAAHNEKCSESEVVRDWKAEMNSEGCASEGSNSSRTGSGAYLHVKRFTSRPVSPSSQLRPPLEASQTPWQLRRSFSQRSPSNIQQSSASATATQPYSYEVLLNEKDREEERLFKLWSQKSDRPQSPVGRKCTPSEVEAREKLLLKRTLSPSSPTSMARDMLKDDTKRKQAW